MNRDALASDENPILELRRLQVRFREQTILRDVSMQVREGETLVVIGESGCGKTVMLKHMIGLHRPTNGTVFFRGQDLSTLTDAAIAELRTNYGYVFQQAALFDSMTVGQNVAFPICQHRRIPPKELEALVRDRLREVGLPPSVMRKRPAELSGGMRKRVGFARALVLDPEIVLYDEPTTGLDPIMTDVINKLILQTRDRGNVTGVVVTHDMKTVQEVADRVIMLYPVSQLALPEPQVIFDGTPAELMACEDRRVRQFVRGEAGDRLTEMAAAS